MSDMLTDHTQGFAEAAHLGPGMLEHGDDSVPAGIHWRVVPGRGQLPIGPVVVRDWPDSIGPRQWAVIADRPLPATVRPTEPLILTLPQDALTMAGWVEVRGSGQLRVAVVAPTTAPNGVPIEITARDQEPWWVASADIEIVRVSGDGVVDEVIVHETTRNALETLGRDSVLDVASLDVGLAAAYEMYAVPAAGVEPAEDRVRRAAPSTAVPYSPRQPWPGWTVDDELARVLDLIGRGDSVLDWLRQAFRATALGLDGRAMLEQDVGGGQAIRYPVLSALGVAATDPGVARWLARCGMIENPSPRWAAYRPSMAVAMVPVLGLVTRPLFGWGWPPRTLAPTEELYDEMLGGGYRALLDKVHTIPIPWRQRVGNPWEEDGGITRRVWEVDLLQLPMPLVLEAASAIPPAPQLRVAGDPIWVSSTAVAGPQAGRTVGWEQVVVAGDVAHFGPVSFVRLGIGPGEPERVTMHAHEPGSDVASPMVLASPEPKPTGTPPINDQTLRGRSAVDSPADASTLRWEVRLGDWAGRWGDPAIVDADPPMTTLPAPPTIRAVLVRRFVEGTSAESPGSVRVEIVVPTPTAPGALPLAALDLTIDGVQVAVDLPDLEPPRGRATHVHTVSPSLPGDTRELTFVTWVTDVAGVVSDRATTQVRADDARPVPPPVVAPRLIVAGRPGPAPDVAVSLTIRAVPGAAYYRFYTAAETTARARVGLPTGPEFRALPRAQRAKELFDLGNPPREGFTLADTSAVDLATGKASCTLALPSGASDVVLVRAVPVTSGVDPYGNKAEGVEAPVGSVSPAYLVVPSDEVPPLPRIGALPHGAARVRVSVEVSGVPSGTLGRLAGPLRARIVEALANQDPFYWPEVAQLDLSPGESGRFYADLILDVPPWARLLLAASVRYASEPTVLAGADIVDDPDLVAGGPQPDRIISPWGALSAPVTVDVPGDDPTVRAESDGDNLRIVVDGLPSVALGSSGFTAIVYRATDGGPLTESGGFELSAEDNSFIIAGAGAGSTGLTAVILQDPFGRQREPVRLGPV